MKYIKLDGGMLLELECNNDRELADTRDEKKEMIRNHNIGTADWQQWQMLYRLRRNRVFAKILDTLTGLKP